MYDYSKIKYLYYEEKEALFDVIRKDTSRYAIRNKAIFYIAEYAALRASEVGLIQISDINLKTNEIYFKRLKNSNNNTLRLIDSTVSSALHEYIDYRETKEHMINFRICCFLVCSSIMFNLKIIFLSSAFSRSWNRPRWHYRSGTSPLILFLRFLQAVSLLFLSLLCFVKFLLLV